MVMLCLIFNVLLGSGEEEQEMVFDKYKYEGNPFEYECDPDVSKMCSPSI